MEQIAYSSEKMDLVRAKVQKLIEIVAELEEEFPGRHFTLDGHLIGSIGEVLAVYHYGIQLYDAAAKRHDGIVDDREVQIKITQQENIVISEKPDYLLVLYMNKNGRVYEVYNGPGDMPWDTASKKDSHNNRHMRVNKLMKLDANVLQDDRISVKHPIEKMKKEYKNIK